MIILVHTITPRLRYISQFIGKEISDQPFELVTDQDKFIQFEGPKINYCRQRLSPDDFWIAPQSLLFENDIRSHDLVCFETAGLKAFFAGAGDFPFDIFAAAFYLLSRYEEWLPHKKDVYGRYSHDNSLAYREGFLDKPLINCWLIQFKKVMEKKFPSMIGSARSRKPGFLLTYDIDEAWSYRNKDWMRSAGAMAKGILTGKWKRLNERMKVVNGKMQDPYDSFDWMDNLHHLFDLHPRYFFLVAERTGKYDRNILPKEKNLQGLIRKHADKYSIGIHPSWQSGDDPSLIKKEMQLLQGISGKTIISSRQHFIRFTLPHTYRYLLEAGIKEDFSMGYGSINGFRASVAAPFYWYDLEKDESTDLLLYPFCYMEANSFFEQRYSATQAGEEINYYYDSVREAGGLFISIWHNSFLGTEKLFAGWREVYENFVRKIAG